MSRPSRCCSLSRGLAEKQEKAAQENKLEREGIALKLNCGCRVFKDGRALMCKRHKV